MSWFYPIGNKRKHIAQDDDGTIYTKLTGSTVENDALRIQNKYDVIEITDTIVPANSTYSYKINVGGNNKVYVDVDMTDNLSNVRLNFQSLNPNSWIVRQEFTFTNVSRGRILQNIDLTTDSSNRDGVDWLEGNINIVNNNDSDVTIASLFIIQR